MRIELTFKILAQKQNGQTQLELQLLDPIAISYDQYFARTLKSSIDNTELSSVKSNSAITKKLIKTTDQDPNAIFNALKIY